MAEKLFGTKPWISWPQHYPKRNFNLLQELHMAKAFSGDFTDVYGDKNISADKMFSNSGQTVILVNFFLAHS